MSFARVAFEYYSGKRCIDVDRIIAHRDSRLDEDFDWYAPFRRSTRLKELKEDGAALEKGGIGALPALWRAYKLGGEHPYRSERAALNKPKN